MSTSELRGSPPEPTRNQVLTLAALLTATVLTAGIAIAGFTRAPTPTRGRRRPVVQPPQSPVAPRRLTSRGTEDEDGLDNRVVGVGGGGGGSRARVDKTAAHRHSDHTASDRGRTEHDRHRRPGSHRTRNDTNLAGARGMIVLATSTLPVAWLVARAAGLVALVLLMVAVTLGLLLSTRVLGNRRGKMLLEWHQALIWSSVSMLGLHAAGLLLDPTINFGFAAVLVPGAAPWRPLPVAAGIVAGWLHAHPRGVHSSSAADRSTPLAPSALLLVRRLHRRSVARAERRVRLSGHARARVRRAGNHSCAVADLCANPHPTHGGQTAARSKIPAAIRGRRAATGPAGVRVTAPRLQSESFRAMGTLCVISVATRQDCEAKRALAAGRSEVIACEQALSRFDPTSDLSRLNASAGDWTPVSVRLLEALQTALQAREETNGRFDPTILPALVAAGYDRSFEQLAERPARRTSGWRPGGSIRLDVSSATARVEAGVLVDLGGIGKGYSATRTIAALRAAQPDVQGAVVDLGGDIAIWGTPPGGGPWRISVADPRRDDSVLGVLELAGGGVAASGPGHRRFRRVIERCTTSSTRPAAPRPRAARWRSPSSRPTPRLQRPTPRRWR